MVSFTAVKTYQEHILLTLDIKTLIIQHTGNIFFISFPKQLISFPHEYRRIWNIIYTRGGQTISIKSQVQKSHLQQLIPIIKTITVDMSMVIMVMDTMAMDIMDIIMARDLLWLSLDIMVMVMDTMVTVMVMDMDTTDTGMVMGTTAFFMARDLQRLSW